MGRLANVGLLFLLGLCCVLADNKTSSTVVTTPTVSPSSVAASSHSLASSTTPSSSSTSSHAPKPTATPTAGPTATPSPDPPEVYTVTDEMGEICIRLNTSIDVFVRFNTSNTKQKWANLPVGRGSDHGTVNPDKSFCKHNTTDKDGKPIANNFTSVIVVEWKNNDNKYSLQFLFTENTKKGQSMWTLDYLQLTLNTNSSDFLGYIKPSGEQNAFLRQQYFKNDFNRSYQCKSEKNYTLTLDHNQPMTAFVQLSNFQVQAFAFTNATSGDFNNARRCDLDLRGSKIVPIAVGAALAGLVIVVLVAYLIGRFKTRKQSSYEALS